MADPDGDARSSWRISVQRGDSWLLRASWSTWVTQTPLVPWPEAALGVTCGSGNFVETRKSRGDRKHKPWKLGWGDLLPKTVNGPGAGDLGSLQFFFLPWLKAVLPARLGPPWAKLLAPWPQVVTYVTRPLPAIVPSVQTDWTPGFFLTLRTQEVAVVMWGRDPPCLGNPLNLEPRFTDVSLQSQPLFCILCLQPFACSLGHP